MQLFAHLLSSYLQGMGDFFSALPRGENVDHIYIMSVVIISITLRMA